MAQRLWHRAVMQVTGEIRWFWPDDGATELVDWFMSSDRHGGPPATPPVRIDRYLVDGQRPELGIKMRGGRGGVEIKGLVDAATAALSAAPFAGAIEIWSKWWTAALDVDPNRTEAIEKQRWVRAFDTTGVTPVDATPLVPQWISGLLAMPARGCNVEVVRIMTSSGRVWWSLGFEAYGAVATVAADVTVAAGTMATREPPAMRGAACRSYPVWLASRSAERDVERPPGENPAIR